MRSLTSVTVDLLNDLAYALGVQPWELLADSETTRQAAMAKMIWGEHAEDETVGKHLPVPPKKASAAKRRKRGSSNGPAT